MAITDNKIQSADFTNRDIMGLPNKPSEAGVSATELKERFDAGAKKVVMPKYNALIDFLISTAAASELGVSEIEGVSGVSIQGVLQGLKDLVDTKQSIEQGNADANSKFDKSEAQALIKDITFSEDTGVFTFMRYDGSTITVDTLIEKIPLKVRLDKNTQELVLTLSDGTEQRADLSAFMKTDEDFRNTDTILLSYYQGMLGAALVEGSVSKKYLAPEILGVIDEKEKSATESANIARIQATNAKEYAARAETSNQSAAASEANAQSASAEAVAAKQATAADATKAKDSETQSAQHASTAAQCKADVEALADTLGPYGAIAVGNEEPTEDAVKVWIVPDSEEEIQIPEIKDSEVSAVDTWSSQKIQSEIAAGGGGSGGETGANGTTFTPHVAANGDLSWTNDGGLANPETVNLKGPQGERGATGSTGAQGPKGDTGAQGPKGADGKTPVKGTDYWTEADKAEIKNYVDDAILNGAW